MPVENRIIDNRTFLLGLDQLYREAIKQHERDELLRCARVVARALSVAPAEVPVEGYYGEDDKLSEYFRLVRALQGLGDDSRQAVEQLREFTRLLDVMTAPLYGQPRFTGSLLPAGVDPLTEALEQTFPNWTVEQLTAAAHARVSDSNDFSLVGLAALARDAVVLAALRESVVLYAAAAAGCAPEPVEIVYTWKVDPEITKRSRRFVETFNKLFDETVPTPAPDHAAQYWAAAQDAYIVGRCVRLGWDDTVRPIRHYHWGIMYKDGDYSVNEFWSSEVWSSDRFREVIFGGGSVP